jgi:hypothetical protein
MIKLLDILKEGNIKTSSDSYIDSQEEIQDRNMVRDFFNYHGINTLALDIYDYMNKNYQQYPAVITVNHMRYNNTSDGDNVLILFRKKEIALEKERKRLNSRGDWESKGTFSHSTMEKGPFSWELLNQIVSQPS